MTITEEEKKEKEERKRDALKRQFQDLELTKNNFVDSICERVLGFSDYEKWANTEELKEDLNKLHSALIETANEQWHEAKKQNTVKAYKDYLEKFGHVKELAKYAEEAEEAIKNLRDTEERESAEKAGEFAEREDSHASKDKEIDKKSYLKKLKDDPNAEGCLAIQEYLRQKDCPCSWKDIEGVYGKEKTYAIKEYKQPDALKTSATMQTERDYTEVYFWGLRGAGKTCAIGGAIGYMNMSRKMLNVVVKTRCTGTSYYGALLQLFSNEGIRRLPRATDDGALPCIPLTFKTRDGKIRKAQLVDVAGEVFSQIYKKQTSPDSKDEDSAKKEDSAKIESLENLERLLSDNHNYKIHFFIIEYVPPREDGTYEDEMFSTHGGGIMAKSQVMATVASYLRENRRLSRATQGIYVLVTKCDRIKKGTPAERKEEMLNFLLKSGWYAVMNNLNELSKSIECGPIRNPQPFSIGDVFAQDLCIFNTSDSKYLVDCIVGAAPAIKDNLWSHLREWFRKY